MSVYGYFSIEEYDELKASLDLINKTISNKLNLL